ncbi:Hypp4883 [Branchiostoma lanceolatum]|uniref:Hypp4883 protein n=1 Tax=Branchiostoma lanceolatum TaxID=7740 RepID=A0A8K0AH20_BRALA|nr:Hypp4883 [Branchiostoma lanceolatum]
MGCSSSQEADNAKGGERKVDHNLGLAIIDIYLKQVQTIKRGVELSECHQPVSRSKLKRLTAASHPDFSTDVTEDKKGRSNFSVTMRYPEALKILEGIFSNLKKNGRPKKEDVLEWPCKKASSGEDSYTPPEGNRAQEVKVVSADFTDVLKREILVISDIHFGSCQCVPQNVRKLLDVLSEVTEDGTVHTLVLLGDIFDLVTWPVNQNPRAPEVCQLEWSEDDLIRTFAERVAKIAESGVRVFYVTGHHDHDMTDDMVENLFGDKVEFVKGILIYKVNTGERDYYVRFEHGHEMDLVYTRGRLDEEDLIHGHTTGYYVRRFCCANQGVGVREMFSKMFMMRAILQYLGPGLLDVVSEDERQKRFLKFTYEHANGRPITGSEVVLLGDGKYVTVDNLLRQKVTKRAMARNGPDQTVNMVMAMMFDFGGFLQTCEEDVVILGHTHYWITEKYTGARGQEVLYANTGAWSYGVKEVTYVKIVPPAEEDGIVEVISQPAH